MYRGRATSQPLPKSVLQNTLNENPISYKDTFEFEIQNDSSKMQKNETSKDVKNCWRKYYL